MKLVEEQQTEQKKGVVDKKFSAGCIQATIWKNDNDKFTFSTVRLQKSYMDKAGTWQHTESLRVNDLPKTIVVLQKAYEYLVLKGEE